MLSAFLRRRAALFALSVVPLSAQVVPFAASLPFAAGEESRAVAGDPFGAAVRRLAFLRSELARHDTLYFRDAAPVVSDAAYDRLVAERSALERALAVPTALRPEPGASGDDRTGRLPTSPHGERMLGLEKAHAEADVRAFHARLALRLGRGDLPYVVEPKVDGMAVSVTYEKGRFVRAVTRGNGLEGDDITAGVRALARLPAVLSSGKGHPLPDTIELRGEIYVPFAAFQRVNAERELAGEPPFANPRNLAAGTIRQSDSAAVAARGLEIVFYAFAACAPVAAAPASQHELHAAMQAWGLPVLASCREVRGADAIWDAVQAVGRERASLAFPTDGAVVKLDDVALQEEAGATAAAPRWAIAYKFAPVRAETRLLGITVQVGRTGLLTPVAELAPVGLGGATVTRASLHNAGEIARHDLRIGDYVYVEKAGEVIPTVAEVDLARRTGDALAFVFPSVCPACGAAVAVDGDEGVHRCPNPDCPAQVAGRIEHFASRACVNIEGFGPALIDALVKQGRLATVADVYRLRRGDLAPAGREDGRSVDRLLAAIEASRRAPSWRVIYGLGIPHVGATTARALGDAFGGLAALAAARPEDFASLRSSGKMGDVTIQAVLTYFAAPSGRNLVAELRAAGVRAAQ